MTERKVPRRRCTIRFLCAYAGILLSVSLPMRPGEAQVLGQAPPAELPRNTLAALPSRDEAQANVERRRQLRGKASIPRERGETGPLREVPDAQPMGTLELPKETQPR